MSRVGINPIKIEEGVDVNINGNVVSVKGPKGEIVHTLPAELTVEVKDGQIVVGRKDDERFSRSIHGTFRALLAGAVAGVKDGFEKKLELVGVGYRVRMEGANLSLSLGLTHPVVVEPVEGIQYEVPDEVTIIVKGHDKQKVGEVAARIREIKKPEPYKGKGIRYEGEYVRRKSAKAVTA
ncbi:MAG: 50S ribosomal protein L6 [Candidatus Dojkabacteria bacterium]|nr:MAG: 50S ribosomal protein L6 [Candidatus Dojkabacteria bacterium]